MRISDWSSDVCSSDLLCLALLAACSKPESAPTSTATPAAPTATVAPVPTTVTTAATDTAAIGEATYKKTCFLCNGTGAGGEPMLTDRAETEPRVAQGTDAIYKHAITGTTGAKGTHHTTDTTIALSDAK